VEEEEDEEEQDDDEEVAVDAVDGDSQTAPLSLKSILGADGESSSYSTDIEAGEDDSSLAISASNFSESRSLLGSADRSRTLRLGPHPGTLNGHGHSSMPSSFRTSNPASASAAHVSSVDASLLRTTRALAETEVFGTLTSAQLVQQREAFIRQKQKLAATAEYMDQTKSILKRMSRRIVTDKIVQGTIILLELVVIGVIIYFKYLQ